MQYLALQYGNETAMLSLRREEAMQLHGAYMAYTEAMKKAGACRQLRAANRLGINLPDATTIRRDAQ